MEVGDMLNVRQQAAADAQLRQQQYQQVARMDGRTTYGLDTNHMAVNHHRSLPQDNSHLSYPSLNQSPPTQQMTPDSFMMGQSQPDTDDIGLGNGSRAVGDTAPKSFACSTCAKKFARRSDLARHERIHSGVRPHSCEWPGCGKQFIQRSALTVHSRIHTGEKPHICERCSKPFSDSSSLARHRRIHSGTRPYQCTVTNCQKTFTRKTTLRRHQQSHTGDMNHGSSEPRKKSSNTTSSLSQHQAEGDYQDNASSDHSNESPAPRGSMSPSHELPPIPNMGRQHQDYGYLPQNGALPPHMRGDYSQNLARSEPSINSNTLSAYTSAPHQQQRASLTSHPAAYGPPQPLEPPANGTASGSGSPHLTAMGWGSPNSPGPIDSFPYPDLPNPSYPAQAHHLYYPGSNIRRPQSTEPEDYGLRPRTNSSQPQQHTMNAMSNHGMHSGMGMNAHHSMALHGQQQQQQPHQHSHHQQQQQPHYHQHAQHQHNHQHQHIANPSNQLGGVEWSNIPTAATAMGTMQQQHQSQHHQSGHPHHGGQQQQAQHHSMAGLGIGASGGMKGTTGDDVGGKYVLQ